MSSIGNTSTGAGAGDGGARRGDGQPLARLTSAQVWRELDRASFAVLSCVTPAGEPRCSGVVYATTDRVMYVVVGGQSWKARHIAADGRVSVTVPVRRGGLMALMFPIPPATITFHGTARVYPAGTERDHRLPAKLERLLPREGRETSSIIEIQPVGRFLTYGIGVTVLQMRQPSIAAGYAPVG